MPSRFVEKSVGGTDCIARRAHPLSPLSCLKAGRHEINQSAMDDHHQLGKKIAVFGIIRALLESRNLGRVAAELLSCPDSSATGSSVAWPR
jgi:hypothetical protein